MRIVKDNDESGNNLDRHFRELRNLETPPSAGLWDRLENSLDEERQRVKHDHWYKALIALLIPFTVINLIFTYDLTPYYGKLDEHLRIAGNQEFAESTRDNLDNLPNNRNNAAGGWGVFFNAPFHPRLTAKQHPESAEILLTEVISLPAHSPALLTASLNTDEAVEAVITGTLTPLDRRLPETSATADDVLNYHSRKMLSEGLATVKGFHAGMEGALNNSWLLHRRNALHPLIGNDIRHRFDAGLAWGISAGYDFSQRCGIEAEWIISSQQGQEYSELRYGKIRVNGRVNLNYMQLPVMFKYKWAKVSARSQHPRVLNLVSGIQYSRLRQATVVQNGLDLEHVSQLFNRDELGLLLGLEYDIFLHRHCFISVGARASISTDARAFPYFCSEKTETYNALIGINAGIHYMAGRKKQRSSLL